MENGRICSGRQSSSLASASHTARAFWRPDSPVPALALPVLITSARICTPASRFCLQICTGAAQKRFCVNTPATVLPLSMRMTSTSLRPGFLIPAQA
ncbi:hypothetical protein D3C78_1698190 [compost metagenome]